MCTDSEKYLKELREGIAIRLCTLNLNVVAWECLSEHSKEAWRDEAGSLLRNLPIPLYIDTGELTDEEITKAFVEGYHSISRYPSGLPKEFCGRRAVAEAARAKFKSIGELMK